MDVIRAARLICAGWLLLCAGSVHAQPAGAWMRREIRCPSTP